MKQKDKRKKNSTILPRHFKVKVEIKIIRKPFGRQSQEIVILWEINQEVTCPSLKSMHFS